MTKTKLRYTKEGKPYKGMDRLCRPCRLEYKNALRSRDFRARLDYILKTIKADARKAAAEFDLDIDYLMTLLETQNHRCYYTGIELSCLTNMPNKISIDRIDSAKGYLKSNVVLCCQTVNYAKLRLSVFDFISLCKKVVDWQLSQ